MVAQAISLYRSARANYQRRRYLPTIVRERLVGLGHTVSIFALANRGAAILRGLHEFGGKAMRHGFLAAGRGRFDDPSHGERLAAVGADFDGHLVGRAADAAGLDLDHGLDVVERLLQHSNRLTAGPAALVTDAVDGTVDDLLGGGFLAALHDHIDEFSQHIVPELGVRKDGAMGGCCSAGHGKPLFLGPFGAVLGPALPAIADAGAIKRAAHRVVADTGKILDAAAADQDHRVFLQIVAFAADVARDLVAIGEADAADLAQRGVRLLRRGRVHARAYAALLRGRGQCRNLGFPGRLIAAGAN